MGFRKHAGKKTRKIKYQIHKKIFNTTGRLSHIGMGAIHETHIMLESNGCIETFFYIHTNIKGKKTLVSFPSIAPFFLSSILVGGKKLKMLLGVFVVYLLKLAEAE